MIETEFLKDNLNYIKKLQKMPSFEDFSEKDIKGILEMSKLRQYEPGEEILKEGSYDSWIFFLISGKIEVSKNYEVLGVLKRTGDVFGEMGIIDASPRSASARAIDKAVCLAMDASYIDRLTGNDRYIFSSILYRVFSQILADRLRKTSEELIKAKEEIERLKW
ncbi:MAG: cyclic nucleotide-binding domain-containing protein [Deltaproteobacteria bacterium]|nr:cyclic nucleotide-binding domain-containing protein [Deltaproteobacteria bacterium]